MKTIHDTPVDNTQTMNKGDDRIDTSRPAAARRSRHWQPPPLLRRRRAACRCSGAVGVGLGANQDRLPGPPDRIGAAYGRWYDRTTKAAVKKINDEGESTAVRSRSSPRMTELIPSAVPRSWKRWPPAWWRHRV